MISTLQMVTVYVSDLERAVKFYTEKLGFVKTAEFCDGVLPNIVWVCPRPSSAVPLAAEIGLELAPVDDPRIGATSGMVFASDDIEATYTELKSKGVTFTLELVRHSYGRDGGDQEARFCDPDGNEFLLHT
jgi:catechol 2,3-dioxygenase-like lactoylglutathione lyase family enzyme